MKVKDLIEALQLMPQELDVYSYCDHGQTPEKSCSPSVAYGGELTHSLEEWSSEDEEDSEYVNQFVIL